MSSSKLLILGGGRYNVPSIRAARKAGFFTFVADKNPEAPGLHAADHSLAIDLNDCDALIQSVAEHGGIDRVVSMAEVGVRSAAEISTRMGLPSISVDAAAKATSKAEMRRLWRPLGKFSVPFEVVSTLEDAEQAVKHLDSFPLIFKPDRSFGGSRGVTRVESSEEVARAFRAARDGGLSKGKTSVLCIGQKIKSLLPYRVEVSVQYPAHLTATQESIVLTCATRPSKR